ncbi:hypothetical protein BP5796_03709 [Coleophoma crateriformis]|uniref:Glycosyltransferase family 1 protein n=1 Tax=Coleophoma crateriformis TaxID=565419 RepID=A0A3D8SGV9_9HELO|nr:hypothetical protein BP5796_03709 [Coleophoma crateriformis]
MSSSTLQIAVYITGHGYGHYTRTSNLLSLLSHTGKYTFHIRTSSPLQTPHLTYALHPSVIQTNAYQLDGEQSLHCLQTFDPSLAQTEETKFLKQHGIQAIFSDASSLPCVLAHSLKIPSILITNFTFDSIFQALLDNAPDSMDKTAPQLKINEMSREYALAHTVIRLPGYIPFPFKGPRIIDAPIHFRKAARSRTETFADLGLQCLEEKKVLLHCFGGHGLDAPSQMPKLPDGWACISQTIDRPPFFYKISHDVYMPDFIGACDAVLGKLGWGTCSEVIGNGYKPFIYVPRSAFIEEIGLLSWMESAHGRIVRLEVEQYESTDWQGAIEEAEKMRAQNSELKADWEKNEAELVRLVEDTLKSALN